MGARINGVNIDFLIYYRTIIHLLCTILFFVLVHFVIDMVD